MFTGIIEQFGKILDISILTQEKEPIACKVWLQHPMTDLRLGESIAVDGICLTVTELIYDRVGFDLSPETFNLTTASQWKVGQKVHLERALRLQDRLGGHILMGHVDCTARLTVRQAIDAYLQLRIESLSEESRSYCVPKGSIGINGVSLTINQVIPNGVEVMVIPHTLERTNLATIDLEQEINIEYDYLAKLLLHQRITTP